jgi:cytochrome c-type biogenesis protein CcmH/NrfG
MDKTMYGYNVVISATPGWESILNYYGVNSIVVSATDRVLGVVYPLVEELVANPGWLLCSAEQNGLLFVKQSALRGRSPLPTLDKALVWKKAVEESRLAVRDNPRLSVPYYVMGTAYRRLNDEESARKAFDAYFRLMPPALREKMGGAHAGGLPAVHPPLGKPAP